MLAIVDKVIYFNPAKEIPLNNKGFMIGLLGVIEAVISYRS
jgi:hypothetical protein